MACGKVDDVILSSIFLVVTWKTESPFLKRKVVSFSLLWFAFLHLSWSEIRFYVSKTTKMNTLSNVLHQYSEPMGKCGKYGLLLP